MSYCFVVPHFNHIHALEAFLPKLDTKIGRLGLPCIVVDDGSDPLIKRRLLSVLKQYPHIHLVEHVQNRGKGAAMWSGAHLARALGFTHMLQIDADGQHNIEDVSRFVSDSKAHPTAIISGAPQFDESAPKARVYGRKVTDFWVALETWSLNIDDSLCGFRIYPLAEFEKVFDKYHIGKRMDFDTDVLVKSVWEDIKIRFIKTNVIYLENNVSHFHYLQDNVRLIWLHIRLMMGMVVRLPLWFVSWCERQLFPKV